jgi:hypothetical protein
MSLYSHEEVCEGCVSAIFHKCCRKFCSCLGGHQEDVDYSVGHCPHRKVTGKNVSLPEPTPGVDVKRLLNDMRLLLLDVDTPTREQRKDIVERINQVGRMEAGI